MRTTMALALAALTLTTTAGYSADDEFVGAIWTLRVKNPKGEWIEATKFRATTEGKVFFEGKQVGTHKTKGADEITMTWDKKGPRLDGTYTLNRVKKDGEWWAGTLKRASDGKEVPVRLALVKD